MKYTNIINIYIIYSNICLDKLKTTGHHLLIQR